MYKEIEELHEDSSNFQEYLKEHIYLLLSLNGAKTSLNFNTIGKYFGFLSHIRVLYLRQVI